MKSHKKSYLLNSLQTGTVNSSRRQFLSQGGKVLAGSVLAGVSLNKIHAGEDNTIRLALVGCGGRGSGAAGNALSSTAGPTKLVAMADVFEDKQTQSYKALSEQFVEKVDVPPERRFLGFDAYRKAIDCLRQGDVMIQATHSGQVDGNLNRHDNRVNRSVSKKAPVRRRIVKEQGPGKK